MKTLSKIRFVVGFAAVWLCRAWDGRKRHIIRIISSLRKEHKPSPSDNSQIMCFSSVGIEAEGLGVAVHYHALRRWYPVAEFIRKVMLHLGIVQTPNIPREIEEQLVSRLKRHTRIVLYGRLTRAIMLDGMKLHFDCLYTGLLDEALINGVNGCCP